MNRVRADGVFLPDGKAGTLTVACSLRVIARIRAGATRLAAAVAAALVVLVAPAHARDAGEAPQPRIGHAYSLETGALLYREVHDPRTVDGRLQSDRVEYRGPDDELFAVKEVDYTPDPVCPAFRLEDRRTGYVEGLEWTDAGPEVYTRETAEAPMERARLEVNGSLVADAGFDVMVYRELDRLQAGAEPVFPFAVPSRLRTLDFRLRSLGTREVLGREATVIRMEVANPLLRLLVDPIDVSYNAKTGALLRYEGISNLPRPDGDGNYRVRIDFPPAGVDPEPPVADPERNTETR